MVNKKKAKNYIPPRKNKKALPTSLTLIGIRDPSSLLYHRKHINKLEKINKVNHTRAQSFAITSPKQSNTLTNTDNNSGNNNNNDGPIDNKLHHLRSYSSIMGANNNNNNNQNVQNNNNKNNDNNSSSKKSVFTVNPKHKKITSIEQLADEYQSDSDEDEEDDDIKGDE